MCATRTNVILIGVAGIMPSGEIASDDQACADHRKGSGEPQTHFSHGTGAGAACGRTSCQRQAGQSAGVRGLSKRWTVAVVADGGSTGGQG